jgi:drug/metabolite transporter (DMT)-like permease
VTASRGGWRAHPAVGAACAIGAAAAYSVTVVIGRHLASEDVPSATALSVRFGGSALIMLGVLKATGRPLLPPKGERLPVILLGTVAYGMESTLFYAALGHGSAAAIDLVLYSYPAFVCIAELAMGSLHWSWRVGSALVLTTGGVVLVTAAGGSVNIEPAGVVLAVGAAIAFTVYLLGGQRLVRRTDPVVNAAWVAFGCALFMVGRGLVTSTLEAPGTGAPILVAYALANVFAFALLFVALSRIGATRTALLLTLEALGTIVFSAAFLGETLQPWQLVGAIPILGGAALVAVSRTAGEPADASADVEAVELPE